MAEDNNTPSLEDQLLQNAVAPKSAEMDGQKVEQHSIADQIAAIRFAASMKASKSRNGGLKVTKMIAGGTYF